MYAMMSNVEYYVLYSTLHRLDLDSTHQCNFIGENKRGKVRESGIPVP